MVMFPRGFRKFSIDLNQVATLVVTDFQYAITIV